MPVDRKHVAALTSFGLILALSGCAPATPSGDVGYERVISAVVLAESDAGGRAFELEIENGTAQVHVAVDGRDTEVDVDLAGPTVTDHRDDGDLDADDRATMDTASTALADAIRIAAAAHRRDGGIAEASLQRGDDAAWKVAFTDRGEVAVSVTDGSVVRSTD